MIVDGTIEGGEIVSRDDTFLVSPEDNISGTIVVTTLNFGTLCTIFVVFNVVVCVDFVGLGFSRILTNLSRFFAFETILLPLCIFLMLCLFLFKDIPSLTNASSTLFLVKGCILDGSDECAEVEVDVVVWGNKDVGGSVDASFTLSAGLI